MTKRTGERWFGLVFALIFVAIVWLTFPKRESPPISFSANAGNARLESGTVLEIDDLVPDVYLKDLAGKDLNLKTASESKLTLLVFWTSTCERCRDQLRILSEVVQQKKFVDIVAINQGESRSTVEAFVAAEPLPFVVVLDEQNDARSRFGVSAEPTTYFVKNEKIFGVALGALTAEQLTSKINALSAVQ